MKWSKLKAHIFIFSSSIACILTSIAFVNCSSPVNTTPDLSLSNATDSLIALSETPYSIDSSNYTVKNYKLVTTSGIIFFQFVSACSTKCPVVVVSLPYTGVAWSQDLLDVEWGKKDPSGKGVVTPDVNGPGYNSSSGDIIAYYNSSLSDAVGFGGVFLKSGVSTVIVYNRFYLGRKLDQYVNDFTQVLNHLSDLGSIDTNKVAVLGASLGGFVPLHASRKSFVKPVAMVGVTPLLDLPNEFSTMSSTAKRITSNPSLLSFTQSFFNSYLRRMNQVATNQFTSDLLALETPNSNILVIHDSWDTVVPISQWQYLSSLRKIDSFIFQHASAIDYNTFSTGHSQISEGYTNNAVMPIYMSYILKRLVAPSESKTIYYYYNDFVSALAQVKMAQSRGQNISWMYGLLSDLCTDNMTMKDLGGSFGQLSGAQFAGGVLTNIWTEPTTIGQACQYLSTHPHIFK